jgi:radical SAM superfamily enzyme YgiQ (UPF0313 family)
MKTVDVLFIYTNINGYHLDTYSFGIGYLSSVLKKHGFTTRLEVVRNKKGYKDALKAVLESRPLIIGFTSVSSQFVFVSDLAKMVRRIYKGIVLCGGVHPTIFPNALVSVPQFDGFFIGESEFSFLDFASKVKKNEDVKDVDNFCYVANGKILKNKLRPQVKNLEELPFSDRDIYDYQSIIDANEGVATIMTGRGCPFCCTYCSNHAIARIYGKANNAIRHNSVDNSLREVDMLRTKYKFSRLWFIDDLFVLNKAWLDEFLYKYKQRLNIPFMCHIRPNVCTRDMMFKLKEAGCFRIFLAVESANDYIRNTVMKRNISKEEMENTFKWAKEAGIETLSVNIIGVPGETKETVMETINFNKKMNPSLVGVNIYSPYEGTELGDYCRKNGLIRKINLHSFLDRRESRLKLNTIGRSELAGLYDKFQYLVYKDVDQKKATFFLAEFRKRRYRRLENKPCFNFLFKIARGLKNIRPIREKA